MTIAYKSLLTADAHSSEYLKSWINHHDSLTEKLQESKGSTQLRLLSQDWVAPTWWDKGVLNVHHEPIFQREIMMLSEAVPYWYARSVIPQKCFNVNPTFFNRLRKESIKNLIFGNSEVQRVNHYNYPVNEQNIEFYWVKKHHNQLKGPLWVRYAEYSYQQQESFYLMEILLPELERTNS